MSDLLRKSSKVDLGSVTILQDVNTHNDPLDYTSMKVIELGKGKSYKEELIDKEVCIVVLTGNVTVSDGNETFPNIGTRESVFERIPTDSVYISNDNTFEVLGEKNARLALCYAPSTNKLPTKLIRASDNTKEDRGKYSNKRTVHNILPDNVDTANSLLVVEVYTNSGNWSSYPPHKHDQDNLPEESFLEEIYYHELNPSQGFVFQRVYTDDLSIDETMTVHSEDCVIVPAGYHPVGVPDGYDSYYLNVMAGPVRKWQFNNDKDHEWIINRD